MGILEVVEGGLMDRRWVEEGEGGWVGDMEGIKVDFNRREIRIRIKIGEDRIKGPTRRINTPAGGTTTVPTNSPTRINSIKVVEGEKENLRIGIMGIMDRRLRFVVDLAEDVVEDTPIEGIEVHLVVV